MIAMKNIDKGKIDLRFFVLLFVISGADVFEFNFGMPVYGLLFLFSIAVIGIEVCLRLIRRFLIYRYGKFLDVQEDEDRYLR